MDVFPSASRQCTDDEEEKTTAYQHKRQRFCCIFDCKNKESHLSSPKDYESWLKLAQVAKLREYEPILSIAARIKDGEVPKIFYHKECRNAFTHKRDLEALKKSKESRANPSLEGQKQKEFHRRASSPTSSTVYQPICIFCSKLIKYMKGNQKDKLIKCADLRADSSVRDMAIMKNDTRVLAIVSREIVAARAHYHRSCYRNYTRPEAKHVQNRKGRVENEEDPDILYSRAEKESYAELFNYIRSNLFQDPKVVRLTELTKTLTECLSHLGVTEMRDSTKKHIQRRINAEFGGSIHFIPDDKGKILVYPDNLTMGAVVRENIKMREELEILKGCHTSAKEEIIKNASCMLRQEVKQLEVINPWPPLPTQLQDPSIFLPDTLCDFLKFLFNGDSKKSTMVSNRVQRLIESIGQDIVFGVSCARVKPPKHILLPEAVKTLTGNVELVQILNRFGHGIAYTQMEEVETALALRKLETKGVAIPENIHPNIMATLAWDNIDRLEETLSGGGTSHRVNGIVIQPKTYGPYLLPENQVIDMQDCSQRPRKITFQLPLLPIYNAGERVGPQPRHYIAIDDEDIRREVFGKTLIWILARLHCTSNQTVSSWTGFNILIRDNEKVTMDNVGYLPTINAPAPHLSTVNEILVQSQKVKESLSLQSIVVVFDQSLYAKATEIIWKHKNRFPDIVPRMGIFHTICNLVNIIGKRFQDGGLKDLCIESGVIAEGSVHGVLDGHKYNRAVRFHKLLYEALLRLAWKGFLHYQESHNSEDILDLIEGFASDICHATFTEVLENPSYISVLNKFGEYLEHLRSGAGDLAAYWMSYLDLVDIMLNMLRASREGDWSLHLLSVHDMIPWCFAYDKQNYARYLSHYYAEMTHQETEHPDVHEFLKNGGFSVQLGKQNPFGRIPVDQVIEETVNKDTQTAGGTKGFSLKPGAVSRYYLTAEYRSSFLHMLRDAVGTSKSSSLCHPDLSNSRIKKDEHDIKSLIDMLENNWINPFSTTNSDLMSISTGMAAPENIRNDLLKAKDYGRKAYMEFREERLETDPPKTKFHDRLKKLNLKTFTNLKVKNTYKVAGKHVILQADRNIFAKMILISQTRKLDMKEVLAHRLGPIPWALASPEGTLRKTAKSLLPNRLKKNLKPIEAVPEQSACIIDGMALVQRLDANHMTFGDVSTILLKMVLREGASCKRIDVVFDVYREQSIKNAERISRGSTSSTIFTTISSGHKIKQWRQFLGSSDNKNKLVQFLVNDWSRENQREKLINKELFVTAGETCKRLFVDSVETIDCLNSSQEEADTRILLHAAHCAKSGCQAVVIVSDDTDVFVLCIAFSSRIYCPIYIKSGTKARTTYTDIQNMAKMLGNEKCEALLGLHAFTGCDTVSSFAGKGKISALNLLHKHPQHIETLRTLGSSWEISDELLIRLESFTCQMYSSSTTTKKVNELRFNLFCARKGEIESWQLPPCLSSLSLHCQRANYQCRIWRLSLEAFPDTPSPVGYGWILENELLTINWGSASPAPEAVMELLSCTCARECVQETCTCLQHKLKCTYMCKLSTCSNQNSEDEHNDDNNDFHDESDDNESNYDSDEWGEGD